MEPEVPKSLELEMNRLWNSSLSFILRFHMCFLFGQGVGILLFFLEMHCQSPKQKKYVGGLFVLYHPQEITRATLYTLNRSDLWLSYLFVVGAHFGRLKIRIATTDKLDKALVAGL